MFVGDLVQEYVGDVIKEEEKKRRLDEWNKENPNDPNFYIMQLEPGWYIDARERGNLSRFINHSCDPNCKLVPKNVAGYMRIAIVAIKEIEPGSFLSYEYQFDTKQGDRFVCRCGAQNCRGSLMSRFNALGKVEEIEKKTKKQLLADAKARIERDQKFLEEYRKNKKERLNSVGLLVPGADHKDGSETVANGPQLRYRHCRHIFLWRNAVVGSDWHPRIERLMLRKQGRWPKPKLLDPGSPRDALSKIKEWNDKINDMLAKEGGF